jgi:hypothetical protein
MWLLRVKPAVSSASAGMVVLTFAEEKITVTAFSEIAVL